MTKAKRVTAADVARLSGVSTATVSYVLNDTPGQSISDETRRRVAEVARDLKYVPSAYAQALARGTSRVAVIDLSDLPYGTAVAQTGRVLAADLEKKGYLPVVNQPLRGAGGSHSTLESLAAVLAPQLVITVAPLPDEVRERLRAAGVRDFVWTWESRDALMEGVQASARLQVRYLHERGHTVIGYCGTDEDHLDGYDEMRRTAVRDEGAALSMSVVDLGSHRDVAGIAHAIEQSLAGKTGMTGIAAYNDETAFPVLAAAHRLGLRVPGDLAVIGNDDIPLAASAIPALTTVSFGDPSLMSADDLFRAAPRDVLTPRIVVRESA